MPWLRTDDGPRKLRAVWLGPSGSTLPFQWTYVQWAVTLCAIPVGIGLLWLVMAAIGIPVSWIWPFAVPWGGTFAVYLAVKVMSRVTFDEPLRYHQRLVRAEWSARTSLRQNDRPLDVVWEQPRIGYLSLHTLAALGWLDREELAASARVAPEVDQHAAAPGKLATPEAEPDPREDPRDSALVVEEAAVEEAEVEEAAVEEAAVRPWWQQHEQQRPQPVRNEQLGDQQHEIPVGQQRVSERYVA